MAAVRGKLALLPGMAECGGSQVAADLFPAEVDDKLAIVVLCDPVGNAEARGLVHQRGGHRGRGQVASSSFPLSSVTPAGPETGCREAIRMTPAWHSSSLDAPCNRSFQLAPA
jgi:hypothetical protein